MKNEKKKQELIKKKPWLTLSKVCRKIRSNLNGVAKIIETCSMISKASSSLHRLKELKLFRLE